MLVLDCALWSAITGEVSSLGIIIVDNVKTYNGGKTADYRVRGYRKGTTVKRAMTGAKPIREGKVIGHQRLAEPVWNLMAKALKSMGYE